MTEFTFLEKLTDEKWTGLRFCLSPSTGTATKCIRLCEAISRSFQENLQLSCKDLECAGALRCLGLLRNETQMALKMSERTGIPIERVTRIIDETPRFETPTTGIELGKIECPDILLAYLKPCGAMKLLRQWQQMTGQRLELKLSAFTSVCTAVVLSAGSENNGQSGSLTFSFGCPDSREYGGVPEDRLIAALPLGLVKKLMQEQKI